MTSVLVADELVDVPEHCNDDMELISEEPLHFLLRYKDGTEKEISGACFKCLQCGVARVKPLSPE